MAPSGRTQLSRRPVPQKAQLASFFCQLNQSSKVLSHSDAGTLETTMSGAPAWRAVVFFFDEKARFTCTDADRVNTGRAKLGVIRWLLYQTAPYTWPKELQHFLFEGEKYHERAVSSAGFTNFSQRFHSVVHVRVLIHFPV
jgi:hypothetical protein